MKKMLMSKRHKLFFVITCILVISLLFYYFQRAILDVAPSRITVVQNEEIYSDGIVNLEIETSRFKNISGWYADVNEKRDTINLKVNEVYNFTQLEEPLHYEEIDLSWFLKYDIKKIQIHDQNESTIILLEDI